MDYKLFIQRIGLIGITNLLLSLSGIILLPILTKNLPIEEYGIWNQINVTIGIVPLVATLGLPFTMVRFLPSMKQKKEIQEIFYSIFLLSLVASIVASITIYLSSGKIAQLLFDSNDIIVKITSFIVFIECLNSIYFNYFRAREQIKKYSSLLFIQTLLTLTLISFFVLRGDGIYGATIGLLIKSSTIFVAMSIMITSEIGLKVPRFTNLREHLNFGIPTIPGNLSSWIVNSSDRYVIGILLGTASVGYYSPGYSLGIMIGIFIAPLNFILPAVLSKQYDENNIKEVKLILSYSLKYFLAFAIPSTFGLSILSKSILNILSTPEIASQGYLITPFVAVSTLIYGAHTIIQKIIILEKKTHIAGKIWTISAALNLALNFLIIPYIGIAGAAITTLFSFALSFIITSYYSFKYLKFNVNFNFMLKSILSSMVISLIIIELHPTELFNIIITIGICVVVYFATLLLLKGFDKNELNLLIETRKL